MEVLALKSGLKSKLKDMIIPVIGKAFPLLNGNISYIEFGRLLMKNQSFINEIYFIFPIASQYEQKIRDIAMEPMYKNN